MTKKCGNIPSENSECGKQHHRACELHGPLNDEQKAQSWLAWETATKRCAASPEIHKWRANKMYNNWSFNLPSLQPAQKKI